MTVSTPGQHIVWARLNPIGYRTTMPGHALQMLDLPYVAGLTFRGFAGPSDFPLMLAVVNAAKLADGEERSETVEEVASNYATLTNSDPYRDMCVAEVNGEVVAYSRVWWDREPGGLHRYTGMCFVHPSWRRRGIGAAMLHWNQRRLREIASGHPAENKVLECFAVDQDTAAHDLYGENGYEPLTYGASMVRAHLDDIPDCPLPEGLEIRPVTEDQVRTIWEADGEAFRDHWGYVEPTEADWQRFLVLPHTDRSLWKVAWDGERVAGQVKSFINPNENEEYHRKRGYTEAISTTREYRRRGLAKALICESLRELKRRGMEEAGLGVHTENPNGAFQLYQGLGYEVVQMWTTYRKRL